MNCQFFLPPRKHLFSLDRDPRRCQFERAGGPAEKDLDLPALPAGRQAVGRVEPVIERVHV
jgi:hypothetical protein